MIDFSKAFSVLTETLVSLPFYTEGPVVDASGRCFFTTLAGGAIMCLEHGVNISSWAFSACPNGQAITAESDHLVCDSREATVKRFDVSGKFIRDEIAGICAGIRVSAPNDIVVDKAGGIYFTDSVRHEGRVFYKGPDKCEYLLAGKLDYPNGLVLTVDETSLLVAESYTNRILKFRLTEPGRAVGKELFAALPAHASGDPVKNLPDGLALDTNERLWIAHYGMGVIQVLNKQGKWLASVPTGLPLTSNVCLTGNDTLLVTGGFGEPGPGAVFRITLMQKGGADA